MPGRVKTLMVAEAVERYRDVSSLVAISYTGISAEDATGLRRGLREKKVEIRLVRNRVTRRAFDELGRGEFGRFIEGPVAVVSAEDVIQVSRAAVDLAREKKLEVKGGWADGKALTPGEVERLAELPPRNVLLARVAGVAAGALRSLVGMLDAPGAALARVLNAWNEKRESQPQQPPGHEGTEGKAS